MYRQKRYVCRYCSCPLCKIISSNQNNHTILLQQQQYDI